MKGIYLTEEAKQELEDKIADLKKKQSNLTYLPLWKDYEVEKVTYEKILSSATILPIEESWTGFYRATNPMYKDFKSTDVEFPNGVIIQPK
jgi:hypothetical protein